MAYQDNVINRVDCKFEDKTRVCYLNKEINEYQIPEGANEIIYYKDGSSSTYMAEVLNKDATLDDEGNRQKKELQVLSIDKSDKPTMQYCDITETEMFGFKEITKNVLISPDNGLWAYHGLRKLKFTFNNLIEYADEYKIKANLVFDHRDNDEMGAITSTKEEVLMSSKPNKDDSRSYELYIYVNTNKLGEKFEGNYASKQKMLFTGYVQLEFDIKDDNRNDIIYIFPVELLVNNTNYGECKKLQKNSVSIDFGTSSSCVAVRGDDGVELLTLSASEDTNGSINIYENPTCVMIYRWEEIYHQWKLENDEYPLILRGNLDEYKLKQKSVQFDFGYSVKKHMREVDDQQLNSILTEIKMIPRTLSEGLQESVRPLVVRNKKVVELVDSYEQQNEEKFDVIAFYGYILGKAINRVEKNKIYTKFQVTYPVKFSTEVREKVKKSLEYGLKRSIPKPLRNAIDSKKKPVFKVDMKYPEPVAYIGSVCGQYLQYDVQNYEAKLFGVFDFGGGTLDYSFGIFTKSEDDDSGSDIHVLGVDGDPNVGGELLIKKLAYWLYTSNENMSEFVNKQIPFEKPVGEVLPDGCPEELFNSTADAKSNVRKVCERFTRDIFQSNADYEEQENEIDDGENEDISLMYPNKEREKVNIKDTKKNRKTLIQNTSGTINLHDVNGDEVSIEVTVDVKALNQRLEGLISNKVKDFKEVMDRTFCNYKGVLKQCGLEYKMEKVIIFEAGNSSRNLILQDQMKEQFKDNKILLVDETDVEFMNGNDTKPQRIALTPKTAVAFGQVVISDYRVIDSYIRKGTGDAPFNWYVGNINRGDNSFKMIIDKANVDTEWKKYGRINSEDMKIYYANTPVTNGSDSKLKGADIDFIDEDDVYKILYIKVSSSDSVDCRICEKGTEPLGDTVDGTVLLK